MWVSERYFIEPLPSFLIKGNNDVYIEGNCEAGQDNGHHIPLTGHGSQRLPK